MPIGRAWAVMQELIGAPARWWLFPGRLGGEQKQILWDTLGHFLAPSHPSKKSHYLLLTVQNVSQLYNLFIHQFTFVDVLVVGRPPDRISVNGRL